jgi:AP-1-like factor
LVETIELSLTATQKRKAQNRAAQRAFRERKEKHLKDLETKVGELEKASEAANHENGLLRAHVDRLQIELREYRKRLSQNSGLLGRTQPLGANMFLPNAANGASSNNFQFEFPKFGSLPTGVYGNNNANKKSATVPGSMKTTNGVNGVFARNGSSARSLSPRSQARVNSSTSSEASPRAHGSISSNAGTSEQGINSVSSVFTPASFNGGSGDGSLAFDSWFTTTTSAEPETMANGQAPARVFQFNSSNNSTASPGSTSSQSQYGGGPNSSCGTSPEPSHNSPRTGNLDTINECSTGQTAAGEITFCDQLNMACGNIRNPIPRTKSQTSDGIKSIGANMAKNDTNQISPALAQKDSDFNFFATLANQNGGGFDPQLFDTYREPQNAIVGDGDFTGGFFNDALPAGDFGTPFDWANITAPTGLTPYVSTASKQNPMDLADALQNGDEEEVVPGDDGNAMLSCHKIWYVEQCKLLSKSKANIE